MARYVWTAKDKLGNSVVREISANTIEESKSALLAEGHTDLVLKGDEIADAATAGMPRTVRFLGKEYKITAAERLKYRGKPALTFFSALWQGIAQTKGFIILIFILAAFEIYRGHTTSLIFLGIGLLAWLAFLIGVRLPSIYYHRLHKAADWYRWTEVLEIVDKLKKIEKFHFTKIPPPELGKYRAIALACLGHLPQALAEYSQYENQLGCPRWVYKAQVAGIYDIARQHDKALEYAWQSIREKPTPVLYLDLANRYLRYKSDPVKAREALAQAEKSTIPDLAKPFHLHCRGILALMKKDYPTARRELEASLEIMQKTPHLPFRDGHISVAKAYLCRVLAKQGNQVAARKNFVEAEEYLVATGETELLEQCKKATGSVPEPTQKSK
jgi:tetratricopeptide (TPR) repeat protein